MFLIGSRDKLAEGHWLRAPLERSDSLSKMASCASMSLAFRVVAGSLLYPSMPFQVWVLLVAGTEKGMEETFGSTCHGAGRARSRNSSRNSLGYQEVCPIFLVQY